MSDHRAEFLEDYARAVREHLASPGEEALHAMYELGRKAGQEGLGVLDVAKAHHQASMAVLPTLLTLGGGQNACERLESFLMEALSPFEAQHRGFREANDRLRELNDTLKRHTEELTVINRNLGREVKRRRSSEEMWKRYESIVNTSKEFLALIATDYRYEAANDAACRAHCLPRGRIIGRTVGQLWGRKAFAGVILPRLKECFRGLEVSYESWFVMKGPGRRRLSVSYYPYHSSGAVTHAIMVARDVTDRWAVEQALRESEEQFRTLMQSAKDSILLLDGKERVVSCNSAALRMFGRTNEEVAGQPVRWLIPRWTRPGSSGARESGSGGKKRTPGKGNLETRGVRRNGAEFPIELSAASWETSQGRFQCGILRDITERKQAEEALRRSEEHYRDLFHEATLMQEKLREVSSKILYAQEAERRRISRELHDEVGQALTAISMSLQLLKQRAGGLDHGFGEAIAETQNQLEETMRNVHRFSHELRPAMLDDLGLVAALRWYVNAFAERTGYKVRLEVHPGVEQLENEPKTVVYRMIQEGLTNVSKYAEGAEVVVLVQKSAAGFQVTIRDDGKGFDMNRPRKSSDKGGLGLVGMEERLRLINGKLVVKSAVGKGTSVSATIPFKPARANGSTN